MPGQWLRTRRRQLGYRVILTEYVTAFIVGLTIQHAIFSKIAQSQQVEPLVIRVD